MISFILSLGPSEYQRVAAIPPARSRPALASDLQDQLHRRRELCPGQPEAMGLVARVPRCAMYPQLIMIWQLGSYGFFEIRWPAAHDAT